MTPAPMRLAVVTAAVIAGVFAVAALVIFALHRFVRHQVALLTVVDMDRRRAVDARARQMLSVLKLIAYGLAAMASVAFALAQFGIGVPHWTPRELADWALSHGIHIAVIVAAAAVTIRAARLLIDQLQYKTRHARADEADWQRRAATLAGIVSSAITAVIIFTAGLMVLREMAIDVLPILTGAGIAGLAVGFGAQNLVRDVISGFFLILEDVMAVGDTVRIQNVVGVVEELNLRTTLVRDVDGAINMFPNGTITTLANMSRDYSWAIVDVVVVVREDLDQVLAILRDVAGQLASDATWGPTLTGPIEVMGIETMNEATATIRTRMKTRPLEQAPVSREFRRRAAAALAARGVQPFGKVTPG